MRESCKLFAGPEFHYFQSSIDRAYTDEIPTIGDPKTTDRGVEPSDDSGAGVSQHMRELDGRNGVWDMRGLQDGASFVTSSIGV